MKEYPIVIKDNKAEKVMITFPAESLISYNALKRLNKVIHRNINEFWKDIRTIKHSFITSYIESINHDKVIYHIIFGYLLKEGKINQVNVRYEVVTSNLLTDLTPEEIVREKL